MTTPPHEWSATALNRAFSSGLISADRIARDFLDWIRIIEPEVNAFLSLDEAGFLAQAEALDHKRSAGNPCGPLAGVPVAVKDIISQEGARTTCGSRILENHVALHDAHVIERLRGADALLLGRTNMDEFGMGSTTEFSAFFPTRNPWDLRCVPGGSSGGSAAAVAARMAPLALGSDTGGSTRQPASLCGVLGLKPTYGRVSRYGLISYGSSLEQIGPFARNPEDLALLLEVIAGWDRRDASSSNTPVERFQSAVDAGIGGVTVGLPEEYFGDRLEEDVRARVLDSVAMLERLGARVETVSLPHMRYCIPAYHIIATSEASSNLARFDGVRYGHRTPSPSSLDALYANSRSEGFGPEVIRRIALGTFALSLGYHEAYYRKAQQVRTLIRRDFEAVFQKVDALACPTSPVPAFPLGSLIQDPLALIHLDVMTVAANLAGIPGASLPCGFTCAGLPVGLQVMARPFEESVLFRIAGAHALATDHHRKEPHLCRNS